MQANHVRFMNRNMCTGMKRERIVPKVQSTRLYMQNLLDRAEMREIQVCEL